MRTTSGHLISNINNEAVRTIKRDMEILREYKIIERQGSNTSGSWSLIPKSK